MKRFKNQILLFVLTALAVIGLVGCGCGTTNEEGNVENTPPENTVVSEEAPEAPPESLPEGTTEGTMEEVTGETVGNILLQDFEAKIAANSAMTTQEMADAILTNPVIQFSGATAPVEEGFLTGFTNAEITGFKEGVMFAPMIGSIPFVGYVFTLEEGADVDAFVQSLKDNADPRWNICTEAEETLVGQAENMVFFVMSPKQFE